MVSNLEELGSLLDTNNITPADLEFIVKFMQSENISPQLAMRRIKAFDTLKSKLESNDEKEKIAMLEEELKQIKNQLVEKNEFLQELQKEKSGLETKSELIDSERDELQRQLEMIKEMQFDNEPEDQPSEIEETNEKLQEFIKSLDSLETSAPEDLIKLVRPIKEIIQQIADNDENISFDSNMLISTFDNIINSQQKHTEKSSEVVNESVVSSTENITPQLVMKEEVKKEEKKVQETKKSEKKITEKEEQILNLFLEFIKEADSDASFKERVSTICDMDEAYQYLGSIGLSQMYSFSSRGIDKKEELIQLLNSWKKEGIPR